MGNQKVKTCGNIAPNCLKLVRHQIESPVKKFWLPRATVDSYVPASDVDRYFRVTVTVGADGTKSTTKEVPQVTEKDVKDISAQAEAARNDPSLGDVEPDIYCNINEASCRSNDGRSFPNESYTPAKKGEERVKSLRKKAYRSPKA